MIIGITGLKGSGKDTVGAYLVKNYSFEHRSFAGPLKRSFAALFDIPLWEIENWKNDPTVFITTGNKNEPEKHLASRTLMSGGIARCDECGEHMLEDEMHYHGPDNMWSPIRELTFREAMQRYGTESHRDIFGEDFWINQTLPVEGFYSGRSIVVTDCRFANEADRIKSLGGFIIRVSRRSLAVEELHRSETEQLNIMADFVLKNNDTMDELYKQIDNLLDNLLVGNGP